MVMLTFIDCSTPLSAYPPADGIAFYAGGDTPHIWTSKEIAACPYRYRLPIWVRSNPTLATASADVANFVTYLHLVGAPEGCLVALDSETNVDAAYVAAFFAGIKSSGYVLIDYGSASSVFGNKNPDGYYWAGDWTNVAHLVPGSQITQYTSKGTYDISTAETTLPFWDTKAKLVVTPIPAFPGTWKQFIGVYYNPTAGKLGIVGIGTDGELYEVLEGDILYTWDAPIHLGGKIQLQLCQ